jgi:hypothetical protein
MWHDLTRKNLTEAAIEKRTFGKTQSGIRVVNELTGYHVPPISRSGFERRGKLLCWGDTRLRA